MRKIRVAMLVNDLNLNGISMVILHEGLGLNPERFSLTVLAGSPVAPLYRRQCAAAGIALVELPARKSAVLRYSAALLRALSEEKYEIVHVHGNSATMALELLAARLRGIPVRIAHCHNSTCINRRAHRLLLPLFSRLYTRGLACSAAAGRWIFGEGRFLVLPNGIEPERFRFDPEARRRTRQELGLAGRFVIGHVGRWNGQKNQRYLLEIFCKTAEQRPNAVLLLAGAGPDEKRLRAQIARHPYRERICVYGETERPEDLYAAMDVFAFPSRYEGFGIALLEAQISGLPCVVSDTVPRDAAVGDGVRFLPITEEAQGQWSEAILAARSAAWDRETILEEKWADIRRFDRSETVPALERLYRQLTEPDEGGAP